MRSEFKKPSLSQGFTIVSQGKWFTIVNPWLAKMGNTDTEEMQIHVYCTAFGVLLKLYALA